MTQFQYEQVDGEPPASRSGARGSRILDDFKTIIDAANGKWVRITLEKKGQGSNATALKKQGYQALTRTIDGVVYLYAKSHATN